MKNKILIIKLLFQYKYPNDQRIMKSRVPSSTKRRSQRILERRQGIIYIEFYLFLVIYLLGCSYVRFRKRSNSIIITRMSVNA